GLGLDHLAADGELRLCRARVHRSQAPGPLSVTENACYLYPGAAICWGATPGSSLRLGHRFQERTSCHLARRVAGPSGASLANAWRIASSSAGAALVPWAVMRSYSSLMRDAGLATFSM